MRTVILIGSSQTRTIQRKDGTQWIYTPRSYRLPEGSRLAAPFPASEERYNKT